MGVDNHPMKSFQIPTILLILLSGSALIARDLKSLYNRPAVEAPRNQIAIVQDPHDEGSEIDEEIEKYFKQLKSSDDVGVDEERLHSIVDSELQVVDSIETAEENGEEESDEEEVLSLSNVSRKSENSGILTHEVVKGDTLYSIGRKYGISASIVLKHNPQFRDRPLYIGEEVLIYKNDKKKIPVRRNSVIYYRVTKGDTLSHISRKYGVSVDSLKKWNGIHNGSQIQIGQKIKVVKRGKSLPPGYKYAKVFTWPVKGPITSRFGRRSNPFTRSRSYHKGLDISAVIGTPIRVARDGIVIMSGRMGGYGNAVFVRHASGYVSIYAHNKVNLVKKGDVVKQGQVIAEVGRTGTATGPHLHFEVRKKTRPINPISALKLVEAVPVSDNRAVASRN